MRLTLFALALASAATCAVAQPAPAPQDPPGGGAPAPQGPGPMRDGPMRDGPMRERMRDGMGPMRGPMGGMGYPLGAHFIFDRGEAHVDISCGAEPVRACVDAAVQLLDKLGTLPTR